MGEEEDQIAKIVHDRGLRIVEISVPSKEDGSKSETIEVLALQPVNVAQP